MDLGEARHGRVWRGNARSRLGTGRGAACHGEARHGTIKAWIEAWYGGAVYGVAGRSLVMARTSAQARQRLVWLGQARRGEELGGAGRGAVRRGLARLGHGMDRGWAGLGLARQDWAGSGSARRGKAWNMARPGAARCGTARFGVARRGEDPGMAARGMVRQEQGMELGQVRLGRAGQPVARLLRGMVRGLAGPGGAR